MSEKEMKEWIEDNYFCFKSSKGLRSMKKVSFEFEDQTKEDIK